MPVLRSLCDWIDRTSPAAVINRIVGQLGFWKVPVFIALLIGINGAIIDSAGKNFPLWIWVPSLIFGLAVPLWAWLQLNRLRQENWAEEYLLHEAASFQAPSAEPESAVAHPTVGPSVTHSGPPNVPETMGWSVDSFEAEESGSGASAVFVGDFDKEEPAEASTATLDEEQAEEDSAMPEDAASPSAADSDPDATLFGTFTPAADPEQIEEDEYFSESLPAESAAVAEDKDEQEEEPEPASGRAVDPGDQTIMAPALTDIDEDAESSEADSGFFDAALPAPAESEAEAVEDEEFSLDAVEFEMTSEGEDAGQTSDAFFEAPSHAAATTGAFADAADPDSSDGSSVRMGLGDEGGLDGDAVIFDADEELPDDDEAETADAVEEVELSVSDELRKILQSGLEILEIEPPQEENPDPEKVREWYGLWKDIYQAWFDESRSRIADLYSPRVADQFRRAPTAGIGDRPSVNPMHRTLQCHLSGCLQKLEEMIEEAGSEAASRLRRR